MKKGFCDAHFHSLSDRYEKRGVDIEYACKSLLMGIDCSTRLDDIEKRPEGIAALENIFTTVGAGPWQAAEASKWDFLDSLEGMAHRHFSDKRMIAIGEIGLDYHYNYDRALQKRLFEFQISLSVQMRLPIILHIRESFNDVFSILSGFNLDMQGMVHCFSAGKEEARKALDRGFYLSFGGSATYKGNEIVRETVSYCPADRILLETDSPYLPPEGKRGEVNTPLSVLEIGNALSVYFQGGKDGGIFECSNLNLDRFVRQRWS